MGIFYNSNSSTMTMESMALELEMMTVVTEKMNIVQHIKNFFKKLVDWFKNLFKPGKETTTDGKVSKKDAETKASWDAFYEEEDARRKEFENAKTKRAIESNLEEIKTGIKSTEQKMSAIVLKEPHPVKVPIADFSLNDVSEIVHTASNEYNNILNKLVDDLTHESGFFPQKYISDANRKMMDFSKKYDAKIKEPREKMFTLSVETAHEYLNKPFTSSTNESNKFFHKHYNAKATDAKRVEAAILKLGDKLSETDNIAVLKFIQSSSVSYGYLIKDVEHIFLMTGLNGHRHPAIKQEVDQFLKIYNVYNYEKSQYERYEQRLKNLLEDQKKQENRLASIGSEKTEERYTAFGKIGGL